MVRKGYPFLFWGRRPGDAYEGANLGHVYEVRFVTSPRPAELRALAATLAAETNRGPVEAGRPVRWSGPWALMLLGERTIHARPRFYDAVAKLFTALHEKLGIEEVVYWNAIGPGLDPWDEWTRTQSPRATSGPPHEGFARRGAHGQTTDDTLPASRPIAAFERALDAARK